MVAQDITEPYVENLAKALPPYNPDTHQLVSGSRMNADGSMTVGFSVEPISADELALCCDGC